MISFNLTALTQDTLSIQRKAKTRNFFPKKTLQNFTQLSFIISIFNKNSRFASNLSSSITALKLFKEKAFANMTTTFLIEEDEEPMATEPIYISRAMRANIQLPTQLRTISLNAYIPARLTSEKPHNWNSGHTWARRPSSNHQPQTRP